MCCVGYGPNVQRGVRGGAGAWVSRARGLLTVVGSSIVLSRPLRLLLLGDSKVVAPSLRPASEKISQCDVLVAPVEVARTPGMLCGVH